MLSSRLRSHAAKMKQSITDAYLERVGVEAGSNTRLHGRPLIALHRGSRIVFADGVILTSMWRKNTLDAPRRCLIRTISPSAEISIGRGSGLTSSTISAAFQISIGQDVMIGSSVVITDSNHHELSWSDREKNRELPTPLIQDRIRIEDGVFIGTRSIILKGVTIGRGSVIGAGSVVISDIPQGVVAAGNPCIVRRSI